MKVRTLVTISNGKDKNGKTVYVPPGEIDLPDDEAKRLIDLGMAKTIAQVQAEAEAKAGDVTVKQSKGPSITSVRAADPAPAGEPAKPASKSAGRGKGGSSDKGE